MRSRDDTARDEYPRDIRARGQLIYWSLGTRLSGLRAFQVARYLTSHTFEYINCIFHAGIVGF